MQSSSRRLESTSLGTQPLGIAREQGSQTDVRQSQEEHDNAVQTQTTTGVRRTSLTESVEVVLEALLVGVDALVDHGSLQLLDVVDTLSSRHDLFTAHEEVVRVGELRVLGVGLGVEWPQGHGELVEDEEVGVVLLADDLAQLLLHGCRQVVLEPFLFRHVHTSFLQQGNTVHVVESQSLAVLGELEFTGLGIRLLDDGDLVLVTSLEFTQDKDEQILGELQNLVVVATESLFEIETGELHKRQHREVIA